MFKIHFYIMYTCQIKVLEDNIQDGNMKLVINKSRYLYT